MKNETKWFSVIVPVYNVEQYLRVCLDSIIKQDFKDFELILVDDGSEDCSSSICDEYKEKYNFCSVIHQKNGGLSAARNSGMKIASGRYVLFVDSDDYIVTDTLKRFYEVTSQNPVDIVAAYGYKLLSDGRTEDRGDFRIGYDKILSGKEFYSRTLYEGCYSAASVYNLTKLSVIKENNLRFTEGLLHEDELWTPRLLCCSNSVIDLKFRFYYYRMTNTTSITRNPYAAKKRAFSRVNLSKLLAKSYNEDIKYHISAIMDNASAQYMYGVYVGGLLDVKEFTLERQFPLKCARTIKYKAKALMFYISPKLTCKLRGIKEAVILKECKVL